MGHFAQNILGVYTYIFCLPGSFDIFMAWTKANKWVRSRRCACLITWFCYQMIAKPGNKTGPYYCLVETSSITLELMFFSFHCQKHQSEIYCPPNFYVLIALLLAWRWLAMRPIVYKGPLKSIGFIIISLLPLMLTFDVIVNTFECHYKAVKYNIMQHAFLQWGIQDINQSLNTQKVPHSSP